MRQAKRSTSARRAATSESRRGVQIGVFQYTEPPQKIAPLRFSSLRMPRIVGEQRGIMDGDQPHRAVREVGGGLEAAQDRAGSLRPPLVVPLGMRRAVRGRLCGTAAWRVVQKGATQHQYAAGVLPAQVQWGGQSGGRMLPHIVAVPRPAGCSRCRAGSPALRRPESRRTAQAFSGAGGQQQAVQLGVEPLGADSAQGVAGRAAAAVAGSVSETLR